MNNKIWSDWSKTIPSTLFRHGIWDVLCIRLVETHWIYTFHAIRQWWVTFIRIKASLKILVFHPKNIDHRYGYRVPIESIFNIWYLRTITSFHTNALNSLESCIRCECSLQYDNLKWVHNCTLLILYEFWTTTNHFINVKLFHNWVIEIGCFPWTVSTAPYIVE